MSHLVNSIIGSDMFDIVIYSVSESISTTQTPHCDMENIGSEILIRFILVTSWQRNTAARNGDKQVLGESYKEVYYW